MSSQVTVEETEHVAIERQADRHATFVALRDKQEEIRNRGYTRAKTTHELFWTFFYPVTKDACAGVRGLDVSDEGDVLQFGEEEQ